MYVNSKRSRLVIDLAVWARRQRGDAAQLFQTTMSDPNRPRENRLKGKFKGLLGRLMGADLERPRPSGSRLEFVTPTLADNILTRFN